MSDVIDFLEKMGQDSALRHASRAELEGALAEAGLSSQVRAALASGDTGALAALLGSGNACCLIHTPTEDERAPKMLPLGGNVCCMIYAPIEEQEQPREPQETRIAA